MGYSGLTAEIQPSVTVSWSKCNTFQISLVRHATPVILSELTANTRYGATPAKNLVAQARILR